MTQRDTAMAMLESAFDLDAQGRESEAIPQYQRAIRLGLKDNNLRDAMVCLGSSLRTVGKIAQARRMLLAARRRFPGDPVVILFLALVEYDAGNWSKVIRQLGHLCVHQLRDPGVEKYRRVLSRKFHALRGKKAR